MSRQLGRVFGASLQSYSVGAAAAEREADDEVARQREEAEAEFGKAHAVGLQAETHLDNLEARLEHADTFYAEAVAVRNQRPTECSLPRGVFYLAVALLLVVGDMTILAGVLAQLMNLPLIDPNTGLTVIDTVSNPIRAFSSFPHVIILTASVLLLGFFPKIYLELPPDCAPTLRWMIRIVFAASIVAVVSTAIARSDLRVGNGSTQLPMLSYIATICLGMALPYVGGIFFVRGSDKIGHRMDLWRLSWQRWRLRRDVLTGQPLVHARAAETAAAQVRLARVSSAGFLTASRATAAAEFSQGYTEGASELMRGSGNGTVFEALKTIALSRALR